MIEFMVYGQLYSMKNSLTVTRRGAWIKHEKAIQFEKDFMLQSPRNVSLEGNRFAAWVDVWYPSMKQDLDCALVYDLLQKGGIIKNDRYIREKHERAFIDKKNPRVHIKIGEL